MPVLPILYEGCIYLGEKVEKWKEGMERERELLLGGSKGQAGKGKGTMPFLQLNVRKGKNAKGGRGRRGKRHGVWGSKSVLSVNRTRRKPVQKAAARCCQQV